MTNGELVKRLVKEAKAFRADKGYFERNSHMHRADPASMGQEEIDAVIVGFLNHLAARMCCLDLAFYASDFDDPNAKDTLQ